MSAYIYDHSFHDYTAKLNWLSAGRVVSLILSMTQVRSVLDVGCSVGHWLNRWREAGVEDHLGLDGDYVERTALVIDKQRFIPTDLSAPFSLGRRFDFVTCLEVAEHLPETRAAGLVKDLTDHGDLVLFSAAPPGQGGENHINEQPYTYWRDLFAARGYVLIDCVRPLAAWFSDVAPWYRQNTFLFASPAGMERLPPIAQHYVLADDQPIRDVSPLLYRIRKAIIRQLPFSATQFLARAKARWGRKG